MAITEEPEFWLRPVDGDQEYNVAPETVIVNGMPAQMVVVGDKDTVGRAYTPKGIVMEEEQPLTEDPESV